ILGQAVLTDRGTLETHPALRISLALLAVVWVLLARRTLFRRRRESEVEREETAEQTAAR
ncbi:MAG: hypothetical protein IIA54_08260, partial [Chloroflexi bacterium]|nr:hypothetical protein [Chloroflexota bacterium]